ncbi:histone H3.3 [Aplysia californica]|uniref:Histone H3.3 n=1 Tax=Aplysia californica TaxID=6500 RepID=A0ABM1A711_APLCA|nr:histone H3.3 [Aplysia californica]
MARCRFRYRPTVRGDKTDMCVLMKRNVAKKRTKTKANKGRKLYKYRPGTVAEREVKKLQKSTQPLIPKAEFDRLAREVTQDFKTDSRHQPGALAALQESAESWIVDMFGAAKKCGTQRKKKAVTPKDITVARQLKGLK